MERRGPYSFAIYRLGEGWAMSNRHRDGCKHDVTVDDAHMIEAGDPRPCHKCGCLLIPWPVIRDAVREFEYVWEGQPEVLNQSLPSALEVEGWEDYSKHAEALWALADRLDPHGVNETLRDEVRALIHEKRR